MKPPTIKTSITLLLSGLAIALSIVMPRPNAARANPVIPAAISACISNPTCLATVVTIGGVAYWEVREGFNIRHIPLAPMLRDPANVPGKRETHAVANSGICDEMLRNFQRQGRRLKLVERRYVGGQLPYLCIFEGADAQPGYYDDNRYK
jgi:hypothetical protein